MNEDEYEPAGKWWVIIPILGGLLFFLGVAVVIINLVKKAACV